ncbi:MAG: hypothetical protein IJW47_01400 [Clostridia bacterium]|nr:hypothetical protein [Clostridia bacterium]
MTERFYFMVNDIFLALGEGWVFFILLCVLTAAFLAALIFSVVVKGYRIKDRAWFFLSAAGLYFLHSGLSEICSKNKGYSTAILFFVAVYSGVIICIRVKSKSDEKERELAKLIDDCVKEQDEPLKEDNELLLEEQSFPERINVQPETPQKLTKKTEVDFGHVKSVMERLELCTLSASDKKALSDLKTAVYTAETVGVNLSVKEKINDGLSALLRIMAKYGI